MIPLPSGTVTFLFTDIEDSTRLLQELGSAYADLLARHHTIMRACIQEWHGVEVDTQGDAFFVAFSRAADAIQAVEAMQHLLVEQAWPEGATVRVRMGLHTGEPVLTDVGYVGLDVHRAARICSAGHGGQVLLSATTHGLVEADLPEGASLRPLGSYRLKDLQRPEPVFQLVMAGLPSEFPPLRSLDNLPNNLPMQSTSFIGRELELAKVEEALGKSRLVTLTGAGGAGKTRLSLQVGAKLLDAFPDGVWLIELAALTDPALLVKTVATALHVDEAPPIPLIDRLCAVLRRQSILLIFDNCEHLISAAAELVNTLLKAAPLVKVLATSREILGVPGETVITVPPLSLPGLWAQLETLERYEAVRLFVDRAAAAHPEFQVTLANAAHVARICQRLDGIPLALELAAARIRVLSAEQISSRLDDRFLLLTGGSRTALPHHQTLRATLDWSYDLLSSSERDLLGRFSIFAGGWTLEAAEAVCADPDCLPPAGVLDGLTALVEKSLVIAEGQKDGMRYRMLDTIRQYAHEKLLSSGEMEAVRTQHLDYYLQFTLDAETEFHGPGELAALQRLDRELDNLRAALECSLGQGNVQKGLRLASALETFWEQMRGDRKEGQSWLERLLAQPEAAARTQARGFALMSSNNLSSRGASRTYYEEIISIAREQGLAGRKLLARGLGGLGNIFINDDPIQAHALLAESILLARSLEDSWLLARMLTVQGNYFRNQGEYSAARQPFEEALRLSLSIGDQFKVAQVRGLLATISYWHGDISAAIQQIEQIVLYYRKVNDRIRLAGALGGMLSDLEKTEGRYDLAKAYCQEALDINRELKIPNAPSFANLAMILLHEGDLDLAKKAISEDLAAAREKDFQPWLAGCTFPYAALLALEHKASQAITLLAFNHNFYESRNRDPLTPADIAEYDHYLALARAQLDEASFQAAWQAGCAMTLEQALAFAQEHAGC